MKKHEVFDDEINPDGISKALSGLDEDVWDRGYCCDTDDGTWFEVYLTDELREAYGSFDMSDEDMRERFGGFHDFDASMFEDYGQITFFVPKGEEKFTFDALEEIFI
jgi:hypothetical protein